MVLRDPFFGSPFGLGTIITANFNWDTFSFSPNLGFGSSQTLGPTSLTFGAYETLLHATWGFSTNPDLKTSPRKLGVNNGGAWVSGPFFDKGFPREIEDVPL